MTFNQNAPIGDFFDDYTCSSNSSKYSVELYAASAHNEINDLPNKHAKRDYVRSKNIDFFLVVSRNEKIKGCCYSTQEYSVYYKNWSDFESDLEKCDANKVTKTIDEKNNLFNYLAFTRDKK